jgi:rhodanese-related sulfurtransferase
MPTMIELDEMRRLRDEGAQVLDVLSLREYEDSHIPGAIHIGLDELDSSSTSRLDRDRPVIAYCYDYQ